MKVNAYHHGRGTVIVPRDALVEGEGDDLQRAVADALGNGSSQIVLDMDEVPFVDSAGLELLCQLQGMCTNGGAHMKLASLSEVCGEILRITDLAARFERFDSVEEAAKGLG